MATQPLIQDEVQELQARLIKVMIPHEEYKPARKGELEVHALLIRDTGFYRGNFRNDLTAAYDCLAVGAFHQGTDITALLTTEVGDQMEDHIYDYLTEHTETLFASADHSDRFVLETVRTETTMSIPCAIAQLNSKTLRIEMGMLNAVARKPADKWSSMRLTSAQPTQMYLDGLPIMGNDHFCGEFQRELWDYLRSHLTDTIGTNTGLEELPCRFEKERLERNKDFQLAIQAQVAHNNGRAAVSGKRKAA